MIPPIVAEVLFNIGPMPVTNAMINSWIVAVILIGVAFLMRKRSVLVPDGLQNAGEALVEFMLKQAANVTGSFDKAKRFLPLAGAIFIIVLFNNWLGLMPGTGSIGIYEWKHGAVEFIPILRSAGSDLNLTLALALTSVVVTNLMGILALGFFSHIGKFINLKGIAHAFHHLSHKKPQEIIIGLFVGVIEFFVGLIEIISELAKVLSLSLRLFGNIFAGEVLITVITGIMAYLVPLPFMCLELIVGVVQATVFAMLVLVYATIASDKAH